MPVASPGLVSDAAAPKEMVPETFVPAAGAVVKLTFGTSAYACESRSPLNCTTSGTATDLKNDSPGVDPSFW